ncbi:MAG: hypothetical protein WCG01_04980 [bacterium]
MKDQNLKTQFKTLSETKVNLDFLLSYRSEIKDYIYKRPLARDVSFWQVQKKYVAVASLSVIILFSGVGLTYASYYSLPGQKLYPFKIATEKIQLKLAITSNQKNNLKNNFISRRINEVESIEKSNPSLITVKASISAINATLDAEPVNNNPTKSIEKTATSTQPISSEQSKNHTSATSTNQTDIATINLKSNQSGAISSAQAKSRNEQHKNKNQRDSGSATSSSKLKIITTTKLENQSSETPPKNTEIISNESKNRSELIHTRDRLIEFLRSRDENQEKQTENTNTNITETSELNNGNLTTAEHSPKKPHNNESDSQDQKLKTNKNSD